MCVLRAQQIIALVTVKTNGSLEDKREIENRIDDADVPSRAVRPKRRHDHGSFRGEFARESTFILGN